MGKQTFSTVVIPIELSAKYCSLKNLSFTGITTLDLLNVSVLFLTRDEVCVFEQEGQRRTQFQKDYLPGEAHS